MKRCSLKVVPVLMMILVVSACGFAQSTSERKAPVPPEIYAAKTVFVANGGANSELFPKPFSGTPSRGYDEFYSALEQWGHYRLVDSPREAELVMELRLTPAMGPNAVNMPLGEVDPLPTFRLVIYDRATHFPLWALTESVQKAAFQKAHDRNFDDAIEDLVKQLQALSTQH